VAVADRRIPLEGDLEGTGTDARTSGADSFRGGREAGRHVLRRFAEAWVAHGAESSVGRGASRGAIPARGYDLAMSEPIEPGDRPPAASRLARVPGERYVDEDEAAPPDRGSSARALAWGVAAAVAGALVLVALAAALALSLGLLVVAAAVGRVTGLALRAGAGATFERGGRWGPVAAVLAVVAVAVAQLLIWLYARSEGGALGLVDYLGETYGPLVPLELAVAAVVGWWTAR
jgi:hypothetical protein